MRLFILSIMSMVFTLGFGCDYCGGSSIGLDANVLSANSGNSIGLTVGTRHYKTYLEEGYSNNWQTTMMLYGSYKAHEKVQLKLFVPVIGLVNSIENKSQFGLGDLLLLTTYTVYDKINKNEIQNRVVLNGGIEFPTGKDDSDSEQPNIIPFGSKSIDFVIGSSYSMNIKRFTMSTYILAKINTANKKNYKYGSSIEAVWQSAIRIDAKQAQFYPYIGIKYNWQHQDVSNLYRRIYTGGYLFAEIMGLQFNYYKHKLAINIELPFNQHLNTPDVKSGNNYAIQYTYQF